MKRTASLPSRQVRNLAHKALKALGFVNLGFLLKAPRPSPVPPAASTGLPWEADPGQGALCRLKIPFEDWDLLFQAAQSRLSTAAGARLAPGSSPQAGDACAHLQAVVLDCVAAMEQLRTAVTLEPA
ncbi:hypothetical protein [Polaromonas sp. YR568]|uniref:hypothetical protein n=1 Tax=Polaromonas sp. YR568 TaxID=1855301 RepID=UPI0031378C25